MYICFNMYFFTFFYFTFKDKKSLTLTKKLREESDETLFIGSEITSPAIQVRHIQHILNH